MPKPTPPGRTFAYVRVSTDMQAEEGQSLEVQRRQLEGWAQMKDRTLHRVVVEPGISAGIPLADRPEGGKLWAELRRGDTLTASKLDRMFRSALDCLSVVEQFKKRGVALFLLDVGGGNDDLSTGNGQSTFFLQIMAAVAQFERSRIGERIRATKQQQKGRGEFLGGLVPFGFLRSDDGRTIIEDPKQQAAIRRIHRLRAKGLSSHRISRALADDGIKLSHVSVLKIIGRAAA